MKKTFILVTIFAMWLFAPHANSATYFFPSQNPTPYLINTSSTPITWNLNLSNDYLTLTSVNLSAWVSDDGDTSSNNTNKEKYRFTLGPTNYDPQGPPFEMDDTLYQVFLPTTANLLGYLNGNNLQATINFLSINGDFNFKNLQLDVEGTLKPVVPIPAAAWLLGTGLIGLVAIRRVRK
jgi:hypothetical protein